MAWGSQLDERSGQRTPGGSYGRGDPNTTGGSPDKFFARGNETLYEAYNQLHTLAQEFDKPFDAPAILVVGQQTDGKSGACNLRVCVSPTAELKWKQSTPIDRQQCAHRRRGRSLQFTRQLLQRAHRRSITAPCV